MCCIPSPVVRGTAVIAVMPEKNLGGVGKQNEEVNVNFSICLSSPFVYIFERDFWVGSFLFSELSLSSLAFS